MKLQEIVEELRDMDRDLKFDLLIEYANRFTEVPGHIATRPYGEEHKAPACESHAYAWVTKRGRTREARGGDDRGEPLDLYFAVENPQGISAKALAVILQEGLSGATKEEIAQLSEDIIYDIFGRSISMGKGQGLMGMIRIVKQQASKL